MHLLASAAAALVALTLATGCGGATTSAEPATIAPTSSPGAATPTAPPASATSAATAAPGQTSGVVPPSSLAAEDDHRLILSVDGEDVWLRNGGELRLTESLTGELFVDPYPPAALREWLDVYIARDGIAVEDASVSVHYDMLSMEHGPFEGPAQPLGDGHYLITLDYIMFGAWDQTIVIHVDGHRFELPLIIIAHP